MIYEDDLYEGDPETWSQPLWKTEVFVGAGLPGEEAQAVADALEELAVAVSIHNYEATDGDRWSVGLTTLGKPDGAEIERRVAALGFEGDIKIESAPVEQKDWLRHVHENFPPVTAGRFFIYGSHYEGAPPSGLVPLKIDAATAFGSGEHETTKGCLLALEKLSLSHAFENGLDMGCGSGILAIAMTKLWPRVKVAAVDIDPESIAVTKRHAGMNGAALETQAGDGYRAPLAVSRAPYDIVVANILAGPLIEMAPEVSRALKPGGFCVLSGLLRRQAADVAAAHEKQGFTLEDRLEMGEWQALVLRKTGRV
jgi:ribosomal protein L11 methyltransferase